MSDRAVNQDRFLGNPPRVRIEYNVELYGAEKTIQAPFVIGVLADLLGKPAESPPPVFERRLLEIDAENFDDRLKAMKPRVAFQVPNTLTELGHLFVELTFESMRDFSPSAVARKVGSLNALLRARSRLHELLAYIDGKSEAEELIADAMQDRTLLRALASERSSAAAEPATASQDPSETFNLGDFLRRLEQAIRPATDHAREAVASSMATFAAYAPDGLPPTSDQPARTISSIIAEIDRKLTEQLNPILHHPDFQRLEGTWRGLHYLANNTETDEMLKIRVMSITKQELYKTLKKFKGTAWDQSPIFKKLYDEEYGQFGGEPYGCLVGDYYFDHTPPDVELLGEMAKICAAVHAPFLSAAAPSVMQMESWQELLNPRDLRKIFQTPEYVAWRSLRASEDSRFIALTMPRFLGRLPYGTKTNPAEDFAFEEDTGGVSRQEYTWINAGYALAFVSARAFRLYGWCAHICGLETGGAIENLPLYAEPDNQGAREELCPAEVSIPERRESELASQGFSALVHRKGTDFAAFLSTPSLHEPPEHDDPEAARTALYAANLAFVQTSSQFFRTLRCLIRDRLDAYKDEQEMELILNRWLNDYVEPNPLANRVLRARRPLLGAEVKLSTDYYGRTIEAFLSPYHQLENFHPGLPHGIFLKMYFHKRLSK